MIKRKSVALLMACCVAALAGCSAAPTSSQPQSSAPGESGALGLPPSSPTESWPDGHLPQLADPESGTPLVTLHTSLGDIKMMLFPQAAPLTVENFVTHCEEGYYDGVTFHRVMEEFMIQGGDPMGTGMGGESIWDEPFPDEFSPHLYHFRGAVSMANSGYGTNGSQFFIVQHDAVQYPDSGYNVTDENIESVTLTMLLGREAYAGTMKMYEKMAENPPQAELDAYVDSLNAAINEVMAAGVTDEVRAQFAPAIAQYRRLGGAWSLDYRHTVFGQVIAGMDVVDAIARVETVDDGSGSQTRPAQEVVIESVTVEYA